MQAQSENTNEYKNNVDSIMIQIMIIIKGQKDYDVIIIIMDYPRTPVFLLIEEIRLSHSYKRKLHSVLVLELELEYRIVSEQA